MTQAADKRKRFRYHAIETWTILERLKKQMGLRTITAFGIDPSLANTAVVVCDMETGHFKVSSGPRSDGRRYNHLADIRKYMQRKLNRHNPLLICLEGYSHGSQYSRELAGEVGGILRMTFYDSDCGAVLTPTPLQVKKYILGTGKGTEQTKDKIMLAVYKELGFTPRNNDEADAMVLCLIARDILAYIERIKDLADAAAVDKDVKHLMDKGYEQLDLPKHRWEVIVNLIAEKGGHAMLDYRRL